jgi:hypothetical protein
MRVRCQGSVVVGVMVLSFAGLLACSKKSEPPAPLPAPAIAPAHFSTARFPPEVAKLVDDIRSWRTYTATLKLGAQNNVLATTTVTGVPAARQMRLTSTMGAGGIGSRTDAVFDGTVGVAKSTISGSLPEGVPAALRLGMAVGAGDKHLRVDQSVLGTTSTPFVAGLNLGTTGLGAGQDLPRTLLTLLDADSWHEVAPATVDGIACRIFEAQFTPEAVFARALRAGSSSLLQYEDKATRATLLKSLRADPGRIAVGPAGEFVAAILGPMGMTLRLVEVDTTTAPAADAFSVASLSSDDADDVSAAVRTHMEPLSALLADQARLDAILEGLRADWGADSGADSGTDWEASLRRERDAASSSTGRLVFGRPLIVGELDKNLVTQKLDEQASQLATCFARHEKKNEAAPHRKSDVRFFVNAEGRVTQVSIADVKSSGFDPLQNCVGNNIRTHRYPGKKNRGVVVVSVPFEFKAN